MARGRLEADWGRTACLLALQANIFRGRGGRRAKPADFMPRFDAPSEPTGKAAFKAMKELFRKR